MSLIQFQIPEENITLPQLANLVAIIMKELQWAINGNLDVKNVRANSITAKALNVDELSAISANLGKVVAGILIGAYIATADGTFPRVELSSTDSLFTAYNDATHYIGMNPDYSGNPVFFFRDPGSDVNVGIFAGAFVIDALSGDVDIRAQSGDVYLNADVGAGKHVNLPSWSALYNITNSQTLQTALNNKQNTISGYTGSFVAGASTVNVSNGIITSVV